MSGIPKVQLDLDQMMDDQDMDNYSLADAAVAEGVEVEKCVVGSYRTNLQQKQAFLSLLNTCDRDNIPIEWVIDIADESNGWFYATAYHYDDNTQMLHVMVPDKVNPTFDGQVQLDYRTVHLIECVDGKSMALFNKIVRDSVVRVKWDVEWYEENDQGGYNDGGQGRWIYSVARYYIRIANQLLVEDREFEEDQAEANNSKGFVIITADLNVRLLHCHRNKGIEDFYRLINENIVSFTPEAEEEANTAIQNMSQSDMSPKRDETGSNNNKNGHNNNSQNNNNDNKNNRSNRENHDSQYSRSGNDASTVFSNSSATTVSPLSLKKLAEVVRHLKDSLVVINEDYEKKRKDDFELSELFQHFVLSGDLDEGLQLMEYFQKIQSRQEGRLNKTLSGKKSTKNLNSSMDENDVLFSPGSTVGDVGGGEWEESIDDPEEKQFRKVMKLLDHATHNSNKLEKQCVKLLKHGFDILNTGVPAGGVTNAGGKVEEYELLKKEFKKLKKELDAKESELRQLKSNHSTPTHNRR